MGSRNIHEKLRALVVSSFFESYKGFGISPRCPECGFVFLGPSDPNIEVDHILAKERGGTSEPGSLSRTGDPLRGSSGARAASAHGSTTRHTRRTPKRLQPGRSSAKLAGVLQMFLPSSKG
jgi:hypothetical protein